MPRSWELSTTDFSNNCVVKRNGICKQTILVNQVLAEFILYSFQIENTRKSYKFSAAEEPNTVQAFLDTLLCAVKYMNAHYSCFIGSPKIQEYSLQLLSIDVLNINHHLKLFASILCFA